MKSQALLIDASDQIVLTDDVSFTLNAKNLDGSNAAHDVDGDQSSLERLVVEMRKKRLAAGIVRIEKNMQKRFQEGLVSLEGPMKALLEIRIRDAAIALWLIKKMVRIFLKGKKSNWRYRLRIRDLLRPLNPAGERSLDEFLFIIWPNRAHINRRKK
jgi:hypothetical protein